MTPALPLPQSSGVPNPWAVLFAQDANQDLDFDEGLEDMDDLDPKPPSRRPLVLILLLLVVAGVGYFMLDPGAFSTLSNLITAPASKTAAPEGPAKTPSPSMAKTTSPAHPPVPTFQEGQLVSVVAKPGGPAFMKLSSDAQAKQPGPLVKTGEMLTILDGALVNNAWVYLVHTKSGASGWIQENQLKAQS